jgi:ABC-type transporter Mla subunit MlaD
MPRPFVLAAAVLAACAVAGALAAATLTGRGQAKRPSPPVVAAVPHAGGAAEQARNLAAWLRRYSR